MLAGWGSEETVASQWTFLVSAAPSASSSISLVRSLLEVNDVETCRNEVIARTDGAIETRRLGKQEALALRRRLAFADRFMHGGLFALVLKALH